MTRLTRNDWWFLAGVTILLAAATLWTRAGRSLTPERATAVVGSGLTEGVALQNPEVQIFTIREEGARATAAGRVSGTPMTLAFSRFEAGWRWTGVVAEGRTNTRSVEEYLAEVRASNEEQAIAAVQAISTAQVAAQIRTGGYLDQPGLSKAGLLIWDPLSQPPPGYRVVMEVDDGTYRTFATPAAYPRSGRRSFYSDASLVVHTADRGGERASADDPPLP